MNVDFQTIFGCQFGFEIADRHTLEVVGIPWGFTVDLGFFRVVFNGVFQEA